MVQQQTHIRTLEAEFRTQLSTNILGQEARFLASTDSTNVQAMQWAGEGAPEGALVLAEYQTAGKGRHGRHWEATPSNNLLFSIILRPKKLPPSHLGLITVAASVAMSETIDLFIEPQPNLIKWPNDILINGKKCCGMLLESAISINKPNAALPVILGIGVNVNQSQFTPEIALKTTSLLLETGRHIPRMTLIARFLSKLEDLYLGLNTHDNAVLFHRYQKKLAFMNESTTLRFIGRDDEITGIVKGVTDTGALELLTPDGLTAHHAGEVTSQQS